MSTPERPALGDRSVGEVLSSLIEGLPSESSDDGTVDVVNPSNGRRLLSIPVGCEPDVDKAVVSARRAFDDGRWSDAPPSFRKRVLHRFADLIVRESVALDVLDAGEMGKPVSTTVANAEAAAGLMRFYAEALDKVTGDVFTSDTESFVTQRRVPRGVVGAITPWNFPAMNVVRKLAPALAAGNCVVLKPSELSSRSAVRLAGIAMEAGVPPGVVNVVLGLGGTTGRALALHSSVDLLTFTGSTEIGKRMLQYAGQSNMKTVIAECGGKSPQVVFDDCGDLTSASESIARLVLTNQGQICTAGSRLLVQHSIADALVQAIVAKLGQVVMGDALDANTTFGPLVSAKQCGRVMTYIENAQREGAELVTGGKRALEDTGGSFVEPTLFRNVLPSARIAQEEIFGPVLSVIPFSNEEEAVRIANGTIYGLAAYVWTADLSRGMRLAKRIRSSVIVNATAPVGEGAGHAASSEPCGQSGVGVETGLAGLKSYMRRQLMWFNHS